MIKQNQSQRDVRAVDSDPADSIAHATTMRAEERLLRTIGEYLRPEDVRAVAQALAFASELQTRREATTEGTGAAGVRDSQLEDVIAAAQTLAESLHIDAVTLIAVALAQAVERGDADLADVHERIGDPLGQQVAKTIQSIEQFDMQQRPGAFLRRQAQRQAEAAKATATPTDRTRRRSLERRRQQDMDALRKMFVAMADDPRVVVIKIADHLRLMRSVRVAADAWRSPAKDAKDESLPQWSLEECNLLAEETRDLYAPLAARLGLGRVEGELEDLAFAILQPDEYRWLSEAVAVETQERRAYVNRVCDILREEMAKIGLRADISGRVKNLYSIYKKVVRSGSRDLSRLYDILAFRIIVDTTADCYLALGHVHELWRPIDGRYKDFIASPKPNGYQSLHTTVFCLDNQLAEIQIRTRAMHQIAEYGVAMHWYYKDVGDTASARAKPLQAWSQQVREWQQELHSSQTPINANASDTASKRAEARPTLSDGASSGQDDEEGAIAPSPLGNPLQEQIFVFTPAGDVKDLPAGATPIDFAYRVHTNLGDHVAGVRITQDDGSGRPIKRLVPLDYELRSGDVVEVIKRNDAHPTRDWLRIVKTKLARSRILRYLKTYERDVDIQVGRDRLDRELRTLGLRHGVEGVSEDDLLWLAHELKQPDVDGLLAALGSGRLRASVVMTKARERLAPAPAEAPVETVEAPAREPEPEQPSQPMMAVQGMEGLLTQLATCCNPLPGDELIGFTTRGRGVVIHRADCPNVKNMLARSPERKIAVSWPEHQEEIQQTLRAPIIVEAHDRTGLLRDVTAAISGLKINMQRVSVKVNPRTHQATIHATLDIARAEQLEQALSEVRKVHGVFSAERKEPKGHVASNK